VRDARPSEQPAAQQTAVASELREQQSLARVEAGGIPLQAEQRLRELAGGQRSFTSDLSVADFALCHQAGVQPLAQVMGSSIYQVGYQASPWTGMSVGGGFLVELDTLSSAWNDVRSRALARLAQETALAGGDAVIGVDLRVGRYDWAESAIEYALVGTAVRHASARKAAARAPVITELSVADYVKLAQASVEPLGIVAWSSVFFAAASYAMQMLGGGLGFTRNQEMPEFTQAVYSARESVVARMTAQAERLGASGVIAVHIEHSIERASLGGGRSERGGMLVSFHATGTAIREPPDATVPAPRTVVELGNKMETPNEGTVRTG